MNDCSCWKCTHPEATPEDYRAYVREIIERCGWMVQGVNGTRLHAPWAYTVGLTEHGLPELVVTGRRLETAGAILNGVADYTVREKQIRPGEVMHLGDLHLEAVGLPHPEAHLFTAEFMYGQQFTAVQMVWMDGRGRLPWEAGHRAGRGGQPVLGPRVSRPGAGSAVPRSCHRRIKSGDAKPPGWSPGNLAARQGAPCGRGWSASGAGAS